MAAGPLRKYIKSLLITNGVRGIVSKFSESTSRACTTAGKGTARACEAAAGPVSV